MGIEVKKAKAITNWSCNACDYSSSDKGRKRKGLRYEFITVGNRMAVTLCGKCNNELKEITW